MLEESSFANRKADYFWLLTLSGIVLLVRKTHARHDIIFSFFFPRIKPYEWVLGSVASVQSPILIIPIGFRANLLLVPTTSLNANLAVRTSDYHSALSSNCPYSL